jgi:hypothetical protein
LLRFDGYSDPPERSIHIAGIRIRGHYRCDRSKNAFGLMMILNMLIETLGGFDYTRARLPRVDAGFRETRVEHLAGLDSMARSSATLKRARG